MAKPGRKPKDASEKMITIALKVRPETKAKLEAMAEQEARTSSQVARFALEDGLELIASQGLKTKGRRRRTRRIKGDRIIRANASRRGSVERFTSQRLLGSRAEREGFETDDDAAVASDPRPAA